MTLNREQICVNTASLAGLDLPDVLTTLTGQDVSAVEILGTEGSRHSQGNLAGLAHDRTTADDWAVLGPLLKPYRRFAVHAPFIDLPLVSPSRTVADLARQHVEESIRLASALGGGVVVVHPAEKRGFSPVEFEPELRGLFRELGDIAAARNVTIGIENMPGLFPRTPDAFAAFVHGIDHPAVGATIDTGHCLGFVEPDLRGTEKGAEALSLALLDVARTLGPRLVHIHIHDVRYRDWRDHREVGTGIIDFPPLFEYLNRSDYDGLLSLELEEPDRLGALRRSIARIEQLMVATARETPNTTVI